MVFVLIGVCWLLSALQIWNVVKLTWMVVVSGCISFCASKGIFLRGGLVPAYKQSCLGNSGTHETFTIS